MKPDANPPRFWQTVRILLRTARKRASGRQRRQQELMNNRAKKSTTDWSVLGVFLLFVMMAAVNIMAAFAVNSAVEAAQRADAELHGIVVVSRAFEESAFVPCDPPRPWTSCRSDHIDYASEAKRIADHFGGNEAEIAKKLRNTLDGPKHLLLFSEDRAAPGLKALPRSGGMPALVGSAILFLWFVMLVFQGEGLELDIQRRRHPMWEWLYSHPIPTGAIFLSEMIAPMAANPIYWTGPLFSGFLYGLAYSDPLIGLAAAPLVGIPVTVAAACLGKALEIGVILRFPPRTRGGLVGLMNWAGYAAMMFFFVAFYFLPILITGGARVLNFFSFVPWPWLGLFLGATPAGGYSFSLGVSVCGTGSVCAIAAAVAFSVWGTKRGLAGQFAKADPAPSAGRKGAPRFGREPLYRKEFLWFIRDRSAIVQTILIPLTVAGYQAFNVRFLTQHAAEAWNYLCGAAILFGTYFLWVLGPKSLASEGSALWIALTWPRGLESLLKAKAWLWTLISSGLVGVVLVFGCFLFPREIWKIGLVAVAWYFFGRSMAEKSVTLVTVTSESGEVQKIPGGRRWAAQLGMLTFAIGICTQQWHVAAMGIVYSWITAAAMWQNFRARLPFLYDPWGETLPKPPTLMHAMISISILIEAGAVISGIALAALGRNNLSIAQALGYAICAVGVTIGVTIFLGNREVTADQVWLWKPDPAPGPAPGKYDWLDSPPPEPFLKRYGLLDRQLIPALLMGAAVGLALGMVGRGYGYLLAHLAATREIVEKTQQTLAENPDLRASYFVMAVLFAPFAEEFLFRGLLFRALDREWAERWGGWAAILGSAAFFAIYHPLLAWPPVFLLGAANCLLFKKTGKLLACVLLHAIYNAVVLS